MPLDHGRLLIVSPFDENHRHPTAAVAQELNEFVAALADNIFVAYASPGGKTEHFCQKVISWDKPLFTLESQDNSTLMALGARPVTPKTLSDRLSIANK